MRTIDPKSINDYEVSYMITAARFDSCLWRCWF